VPHCDGDTAGDGRLLPELRIEGCDLQENNDDNYIPAFSFILESESSVPTLKGALTKVMFETNL
jgi:hypothetical protein